MGGHDTELHKVANQGDTKELLDLLKTGQVDINAQGAQGRTPLHRALGSGHTETAQALLDQNADATIIDSLNRTSLHWAVLGQASLECAQLLLAASKDDFQLMLNVQSQSGSTPLHCALDRGHKECAQLLVNQGARTDLVDEDKKTCVRLAKERNLAAVLKKH